MVSTVTSTTFSQLYKDDFTDSDNYHKILFNSGRAVQARELTQLQTIIQREAERHGRFTFKEGAPVSGGSATVNNMYEFVKLDTTVYSLPTVDIIGEEFEGQTSGVKVRVVEIAVADNGDPATIYVTYTDGGNSTGGATAVRLTAGEIILGSVTATQLKAQTTNTTANPATGRGCQITTTSSVYFVSGHFVSVAKQSMILSKYSNLVDTTVGFAVSEQVVTSADNLALYDNQGATPNLSAPGADRYQIVLNLTTEDLVDSDQTFISAFAVVNGSIVNPSPSLDKGLADLGRVLAQRTHEESGSYTVKPHIVHAKSNDSDASKIDLIVGPGIAYVQGFRHELINPGKITVSKPRTTETINNDVVAAGYGNYILSTTTFKGLPNVDTFATVNLRSAVTHGGSTIGTCRVRAVEQVGTVLKVYVFDVSMNVGQSFRSVRSIGTAATNYFNVKLTNGVARIEDAANRNPIFPLRRSRAASISDISLVTQRRFTGTTTAGGEIQFNLSATGETFANSSDWIVSRDSDGDHYGVSVSLGGVGTASTTIDGLPTSSAVTLLGYVNKGTSTVKTKTLTTATSTLTPNGDATVDLAQADVYDITSVTDSTTLEDITYKYKLDTGQRDAFYDVGKLTLKKFYSAPSGNVSVVFRYFAHGSSGDFFAVGSYTGQVAYDKIPYYRQSDGQVVALRDVLDFRPRKANAANNFTSAGALRMELPKNTSLIRSDNSYYNGKAGNITITPDGDLLFLSGEASSDPKTEATPANSMDIAYVLMNPYGLNDSDVSISHYDNKRYTMRDIGRIEKRMDKIEEITTLSLLELETNTLEVLDSSGNNRLKVGLTADNFSDMTLSATDLAEYRASIDVISREVRAPFVTHSTELVYDSSQSSYTRLIGDIVYPVFDDVVYSGNTIPTDAISVNSYNLGIVKGNLKLSPSSDTWIDTERAPVKIVKGSDKLKINNKGLWNDWNFNWSGLKADADQSISKVKTVGRTTTTIVAKVVKDESVSESLGDKMINKVRLDYMRNKFVFFKAEGLRPNTRYFAFFDGKEVSGTWVQTGSGKFQYYASLAKDSTYLNPGNGYKNNAKFPKSLGSPTAQIFSDADGVVEGVFFIPNRNNMKFLSGERSLLITDVQTTNKKTATSYAETSFTSAGQLYTYQETVKSSRKYKIEVTESVYTKPNPPQPVANDPTSTHGSGSSSIGTSGPSYIDLTNPTEPVIAGTPPRGSSGAPVVSVRPTSRPDDLNTDPTPPREVVWYDPRTWFD